MRPVPLGDRLAAAQVVGEAGVRRVDVEHPELGAADVGEPVRHARRSRHEAPRAGTERLGADHELRLAAEHVEGVHEVVVGVRADAFEVGPEAELDDLELGELAQDPMVPLGPLDELTAFGAERDDPVHGEKYRDDTATIDRLVVGIVGAGAMGSALGARLRSGGARVLVALDGRSARTRALAEAAALEDVGSLESLAREADVLLSVVPPDAAPDVATAIAGAATTRLLVADLNAVSPATMERIAAVLAAAGHDVVDGSISGPPPHAAGTTRVYLSGPRASEVAALPLDGVERVVVGDAVGLASAVKMCTASVYKGRVALLVQALRTAQSYGVVEHVLGDLADTGLADRARTGATLGKASAKAWRYVAEMEEIAATQSTAGLTPALFEALAEVYADLAQHAVADAPEDVADDVPLAEVLRRLTEAGADRDDGGGSPRTSPQGPADGPRPRLRPTGSAPT